MPQFRGVVKHLVLINVLLFIAVEYVFINIPGDAFIAEFLRNAKYHFTMHFPSGPNFEPYQILTYMFMHGDWQHLLFNMFSLWMFGSALEMTMGSKRFLNFYLICGFGALALQVLLWYFEASQLSGIYYSAFAQNVGVLGASGAIFGVMTGYAIYYPNTQIMLLFPPIPLKAKYFIPILMVLELFMGISNFNTGVAHFAHIGGALIGFILLRGWTKISYR